MGRLRPQPDQGVTVQKTSDLNFGGVNPLIPRLRRALNRVASAFRRSGGRSPGRACGGVAIAALIAAAPVAQPVPAAAYDLGAGQLRTEIGGEDFEMFTYRPSGCAAPSLLFVFHGNGRTAESYRDSAQEIADRGCFVVYTPLFDRDRFPSWSYHRGGMARDGELLPEEEWTVEFVSDMIDWARKQEERPEARVFLFGHSAGGQFLSRVAAYALPDRVERIVLANPSTYVVPSDEEDAPYGFGLLPEEEARNMLKTYLGAPVTVYLGLEDTGDEDLTMTEEAQRQGGNRLDRGRHIFAEARRVAEENGWDFNWELVYADGIGHTGRGMLTSDEMFRALGF
jgi:pimeloyl-ACP methyl ester carboxylesterase